MLYLSQVLGRPILDLDGERVATLRDVIVRVDARNISTTYAYDALNRNYTVSYSDGTPTVYRYYDASTNGRGRLYWQQAVGVFANVIDSYDAMGRVKQYRQHFWVGATWSSPFNISRNYDYAGDVASQTYPSGHTVSYAYDIAGRISNYSGTLGDGVTRTYSTGLSFSEFGGIQQEQFGTATPLYHKERYNGRGQLYDIRLSTQSIQTAELDWNRGCLAYYFGGADWGQSNSTNNGNVTLHRHFAPANDQISDYAYTQDAYYYDSLNRLSSTTELHGDPSGQSGQDYAQVYNYDRFGNRTVDQTNTWGNYIPKPNYTVDTNTNRLIAPSGYTYNYDAAGNQTFDNYTGEGTRTYDAENHMTQAWANNQWQTYTYDANGKRIKRVVNGNEVWQIYGLGGELVAEYKSGGAVFLPSKEYGYRGGELLVTMSSGDDNRLSRFVTNLYRGALQRDPTSSELTNGINSLASAGAQGYSQLLTAASDLARGLFQQTGYETSPYRSDIQFVADLYYTYLQRGPDDGGLNWWAGQVPSNGRSNVALGFEYSGEFQTLVATLYGSATSDNQRTEHFVNNFYLAVYGRDATSYEIQVNRDALNNAAAQGLAQVQSQAETMARNLFASQVTDYSISDQQFVTNLYEGFLQRGPDAGGLGFWTSIAANGNRQNVLNGFAASTEFRELSGTLYREEYWLVNDRLGTPRMIVDKSGSLASVRRHDYLPFGEELYAGTGGRATTQGYMGDSTRQKFTGYEADAETGLNFAQARYQSPVQGRFTSVDPLGASASTIDPQSFNRYSYVQNNSTNATDPTGMMLSDIGVYQTDNQADAAMMEHQSLRDFQMAINGGYQPPPTDDHEDPEILAHEEGHSHDEGQQNSNLMTASNGNAEDEAIDQELGELFTDGGLVRGASAYRNKLQGDTHFRLANGTLHTIHIFGDESGTSLGGVYIPKEFSQIKFESPGVVVATNPVTGEVIGANHINVHSNKELERNLKMAPNSRGSRYIGQIGGPGGEGANDTHAHLSIFPNADSRRIARIYKGDQSTQLRDFDSRIAPRLGDFRKLLR